MLDPHQSRQRHKRLLDRMAELKLDAVAVGWPQHVYYLGAFWTHWLHQSALVLFSDGRSWMATANSPAKNVAADEVVSYEAQWNATQRQEQPAVVAQLVAGVLTSRRATRVGVDASPISSQIALQSDLDLVPIDPVMWDLRRTKDDDELALMEQAIRCTQAMYERARQIIEPGVLETHVFTELHAAAVETAGEPLSAYLGNDYACGSGGGPPRKDRAAKDGELYILDLGPCYRGYFADNSRVFAVNRKPTDVQLRAWETVNQVFGIVESMAKPGVRCRDIFATVDQHFSLKRGKGMPHHVGHGVGLQPHEYPHLNPAWDDVLRQGDVFTAEPGVYGAELAGGIRLENQYLVTSNGVENLTKFPLEMV